MQLPGYLLSSAQSLGHTQRGMDITLRWAWQRRGRRWQHVWEEHTAVAPDWAQQLVAAFADPAVAVVGPRLVPDRPPTDLPGVSILDDPGCLGGWQTHPHKSRTVAIAKNGLSPLFRDWPTC